MNPNRFEYRIFGKALHQEQRRLAALSDPVPMELQRRISHEYYLIPPQENRYNIKIRDGKIDIKYLVQTVEGFEQWQPKLKFQFPLDDNLIKKKVFPALGVSPDTKTRNTLSITQLLDLLKLTHAVRVVKVKKIRRAYIVKRVICEFASLNLEKTRTTTISAESDDIRQLQTVVDQLGLNRFNNTNYIKAIREILQT